VEYRVVLRCFLLKPTKNAVSSIYNNLRISTLPVKEQFITMFRAPAITRFLPLPTTPLRLTTRNILDIAFR